MLALALLVGGCVDDEVVGVSTGLLVVEPLGSSLAAGSQTEIAFQAVDDSQTGVPDQSVEIVISDTSRLRFVGSTDTRSVVRTGRHDSIHGVLVDGAAIVKLTVPADAPPGVVSVVASLAGDRNSSSTKTQYASFDIEAGTAGRGGEGGAADAAGAGGTADAAGTGGTSEAGEAGEMGVAGVATAGAGG